MASLSQTLLFGWDQIEVLGDVARLKLVLENLPDEPLMRKLEAERDRGRDRYPIRPMWNALMAGIVFQHPTVEALLRELRRNAQLRQVCGFEHYRYHSPASKNLRQRRDSQSPEIVAYANRAMARLHHKYVKLVMGKGRKSQVAVTAVARDVDVPAQIDRNVLKTRLPVSRDHAPGPLRARRICGELRHGEEHSEQDCE